uniref:Uncharacterized protein n=1 Tax=Peromyscus maniculatus bairdii TaxID=230844 RepID=A0A8C8UMN5_PERMB
GTALPVGASLSHQRIRTNDQEGLPCLSHPSVGLAGREGTELNMVGGKSWKTEENQSEFVLF